MLVRFVMWVFIYLTLYNKGKLKWCRKADMVLLSKLESNEKPVLFYVLNVLIKTSAHKKE